MAGVPPRQNAVISSIHPCAQTETIRKRRRHPCPGACDVGNVVRELSKKKAPFRPVVKLDVGAGAAMLIVNSSFTPELNHREVRLSRPSINLID